MFPRSTGAMLPRSTRAWDSRTARVEGDVGAPGALHGFRWRHVPRQSGCARRRDEQREGWACAFDAQLAPCSGTPHEVAVRLAASVVSRMVTNGGHDARGARQGDRRARVLEHPGRRGRIRLGSEPTKRASCATRMWSANAVRRCRSAADRVPGCLNRCAEAVGRTLRAPSHVPWIGAR